MLQFQSYARQMQYFMMTMFFILPLALFCSMGDCMILPQTTNHKLYSTMTTTRTRSSFQMALKSTASNNENDERQKLLEKAKKLREEATSLENIIRNENSISIEKSLRQREAQTQTQAMLPKEITDLKESIWNVSYRFSSQPKVDGDEENNNGNLVVLPNYSGKLTLVLKADGYSELVSSNENNKIKIEKIWGWDEEYSQEDQEQYLLFSMDVQFPKSDPLLPNGKERYYFQAQIKRDKKGVISLADGTITVKKDVTEKTKGMWGLFNVAGILTQFRYVGDFIAKPSS